MKLKITFKEFTTYSLVLFLGILIGTFSSIAWITFFKSTGRKFVEMRETGYEFINPLLECGDETEETTELLPFRDKIEDLKDALQENDESLKNISIYFRELNDGPWFSINRDAKFAPASLLKVPLMIALLKEAEENPNLLSTKVKISFPSDLNEGMQIRPSVAVEQGKYYTIDELLYRMIVYSDNNAANFIEGVLNPAVMRKTYAMLGVDYPYNLTTMTDYVMTVKAYGSFFRILFNSSVLSREMSEKALKILSEVDYKNGLVAGVPGNMKISHKFGEREFVDTNLKQLHDCGIIYYPQRPYLLCVMTQGDSLEHLSEAVRKISQSVFLEIDSQRGLLK